MRSADVQSSQEKCPHDALISLTKEVWRPAMQWLGIDIGGANLKMADGHGMAEVFSFPLWRQPDRLTQQLRTVIAQAPECDHLVVSMTGELADCFESKAAGVRFILEALVEAADGRHTRVYLTNGILVTPQVAMQRWSEAAAANWHALARFAGRLVPSGGALLVDVGSTTTDVIPLEDGQPVAQGHTDTERLLNGELVYTGVERSPVCAVVHQVPYRGRSCPVAQELFAMMRDVHVILGHLPENSVRVETADGRPDTKAYARMRLARMICADASIFNHRDAVLLAQHVADAQALRVAQAIGQVIQRLHVPLAAVVVSGHGEFVAQRALELLQIRPEVISLSKRLGARVSRCATAHALAVIASENVK